jgi:hypothetical protein
VTVAREAAPDVPAPPLPDVPMATSETRKEAPGDFRKPTRRYTLALNNAARTT